MKLNLLSLLLCSCVFSASAQNIKFGIKAGLNASGLGRSNYYDPNLNGSNTIIGFQGGAFANLALGKISIQPGIMYTGKGGSTYMRYVDDDIVSNIYGKASIYYLEVPVNVIYHVPLTGGKLFIGAGPYISRAVNGRFNAYNKPDNYNKVSSYYRIRYESDVEFNNTNYNAFKALDYGINGLIGIQFNKVLLNVNYDMGLANINPSQRNDYKEARTRSAGLSLGYMF